MVKPRRSRAYNLVVLAVTITLLNIWIAATLPLWSHQIQRDKEAELIFRGLQIAEALRVFQLRNQRLPTKLEELVEIEPRCIRQIWENPMREDGRWGLIPVGLTPGQPGRPGQPGQPGQPGPPNPGDPGRSEDDFGSGFGDEDEGEDAGVLLSRDPDDDFGAPPSTVQIRGVYHPGDGEPILSFLGKDNYREWLFTLDLYESSKALPAPDNPGFLRPMRVQFIGKPWPPGVVPQVPQPSPDPRPNQPQGGNPEDSGRIGTQQNVNPRPQPPPNPNQG